MLKNKFYASLITFILFFSISLTGQELMKYSHSSDPSLPAWAREMYKENADPGEVIRQYEAYYANNPFVKNGHTQYFKKWLRSFAREHKRTKSEDRTYLLQREKANAERNNPSDWQSIGPYDWDHSAAARSYAPGSAHVYTVEQSISNPNVVYAGTATAGLWRSSDRGITWTPLTANLLVNTVYAIEIDYTNENIVYASLSNSIYKSVNGGNTFLPTGSQSFQNLSLSVRDIRMLPSNNNILFACTNDGLYRTTDGATTWTMVQAGDFQEVEIHPTNHTTVYAVRKNGTRTEFFRSTNSGLNFSLTGTGWPVPPAGGHQERTEIAVSPANPNHVYAHCSGLANGGSGLYGVYVSTDQGSNWTFRCCGPQPAGPPSLSNPNLMAWSDDGTDDGGQYYYDMGFAVSPTNTDSIFLAGVNLWVSSNGGNSFTCPSKWSHSYKPNYVHADIHDIQYYQHTREIWVACDGGIFYSNDKGQNFQRRNVGITGTDFWGYGQGWWYGDVMLGGAYHNGTMLREENVYLNDWLCTDGGDGTMGFVNPGLDRQVYSQYDIKTLKSDRTISPVARTFSNKPNNTYITGASNDLLIDPRYYMHWLTGSGTKLYRTKDDGYTFEMLYDFGVDIASMDHCWSNLNVIYVCTFPDWWGTKRIYRSVDGGYNFVEITPSSAILGGTSLWIPYDIVVDHDDPMKVWIARTSMYDSNINGFSVFYSSNGGANWQNISGTGLHGQSPTSMFLQKGSAHGLYIGTRKGVYYKDDNLSDWVLFSQGLPAQTHSTRMEAYYRKQKIRNATDRSVWESPMYTNSTPVAFPSANTDKIYCSRDTVYFVDHSVVSDQNVSWQWNFPGGSPASSTLRNPKVIYSNTGNYDVTLTVTDVFGTATKTIPGMISFENRCELDTIPGKSLSLNANTDYAVIQPYNITTNTMTISCWVKPNGIQATNAGIIFSGSGGACGLNVRSNNQLGYHWADNPGSYGWNGGPVLPANEWSHVVLVISPTSAVIYLNGVPYTRNATHNPVTFSSDFRLGRDRNNSSRNFIGQMDEVAIYNESMTIGKVRELRHLTRKDENNILSYYQFNEISGNAYDKIGIRHAILIGNAGRITSTAPVGGGTSHRMTVNSGGLKDFQEADVKLYLAATGTYPNGEVVMSKLNVLPDNYPSGVFLPKSYWIMNNYGSNQTFAVPDSVRFYSSGNIAGGCQSRDYFLYRRLQNGEGYTWSFPIDESENYNPYPPDDFINFGLGNNMTTACQYFILMDGKPNPNATEICNGIDDNCNGLVDEEYSLLVSNNADSGDNTLRAVLNCVQDGDVVLIDASVDTIILQSPLIFNKNFEILDQNGNKVVIKANLNDPGFINVTSAISIQSGANVTCTNIHFSQLNNTETKPLILNQGTLIFEDCDVSGNPDSVIKHAAGAQFQAIGNVNID
ncbi:MAG: PKD domain-containing protein [Saprospiraceae bacterium]|nr:PKD domain-containing protein [Saprospiraceae bacterium]